MPPSACDRLSHLQLWQARHCTHEVLCVPPQQLLMVHHHSIAGTGITTWDEHRHTVQLFEPGPPQLPVKQHHIEADREPGLHNSSSAGPGHGCSTMYTYAEKTDVSYLSLR
jgi:hypothetical protein